VRLLIPILFLCSIAYAQSGVYQIKSLGNKDQIGKVHLSESYIKIILPSQIVPLKTDSVVFPVTEIIKDKDRVFYFLEDFLEHQHYHGSAVLYFYDEKSGETKEGKKVSRRTYVLRMEIRTVDGYYTTRYSIYYDN